MVEGYPIDTTDEFRFDGEEEGGGPGSAGEDGVELDPHRISQRQKQVNIGYNTPEYARYIELMPKEKRGARDPRTPDVTLKMSKRKFDGLLRVWRKQLHGWERKSGGRREGGAGEKRRREDGAGERAGDGDERGREEKRVRAHRQGRVGGRDAGREGGSRGRGAPRGGERGRRGGAAGGDGAARRGGEGERRQVRDAERDPYGGGGGGGHAAHHTGQRQAQGGEMEDGELAGSPPVKSRGGNGGQGRRDVLRYSPDVARVGSQELDGPDPADVFTRLGGAASLVGDSEGAQREEWDGQEPLVAGLEEATMEEPDEDGWGEDVVL